MFNHTDLVRLEDLKQGIAIYVVHSLGGGSFLQTSVVHQVLGEWVEVFTYYEGAENHTKGKRSLRDMGVIPNNYNDHKTFSSLTAAQSYLDQCLATYRPKHDRDVFILVKLPH